VKVMNPDPTTVTLQPRAQSHTATVEKNDPLVNDALLIEGVNGMVQRTTRRFVRVLGIGENIIWYSDDIWQILEEEIFNYLGILISYGKEVDIDNKLHKLLKITGIITICSNLTKP
jgi:hypothetical protein